MFTPTNVTAIPNYYSCCLLGQVVVGCQLTSLGMALLSHLPDSSVTSYQKCKHGVYMPSLLTGDIMESSNQAKQAKEKPTPETESLSAALLDMASDKAAEVVETVDLFRTFMNCLLVTSHSYVNKMSIPAL